MRPAERMIMIVSGDGEGEDNTDGVERRWCWDPQAMMADVQ